MSIRPPLRALLADRHAPEAVALLQVLLRTAERRVARVVGTRWRSLLTDGDVEEIVSDVTLQLLMGALARFQGDTLAELVAFVRTVTDRTLWRTIDRRLRQERALTGPDRQVLLDWTRHAPSPDALVELAPDSPLSEEDQAYLEALLAAGSKAEHARRQGVSRAAVTQRLQRIRSRLDALAPEQQEAHEAWLHNAASEALDRASGAH